MVELLADVFCQKPQHEVTVFLKQGILAAVAAISLCACEVLAAIEFDDQAGSLNRAGQLPCCPSRQTGLAIPRSTRIGQPFREETPVGGREKPRLNCVPVRFLRRCCQISCDMHKQTGQWCVDSVSNEPAHCCCVVAFPLRIDGQWNFRRPASNGTARQQNCVANRFVTHDTAGRTCARAWEHSGPHSRKCGLPSCLRTVGADDRHTGQSCHATKLAALEKVCRAEHHRIPRQCICPSPTVRVLRLEGFQREDSRSARDFVDARSTLQDNDMSNITFQTRGK